MGSRQYFLGIGGDQTGPYPEDDVLNRIRQGEVPPDALVWFEGLADWQPIQSVEFLKAVYQEAGADFTATNIEGLKTPAQPRIEQRSSSPPGRANPAAAQIDASTFSSSPSLKTVFSDDEATFGQDLDDDDLPKSKTKVVVGALLFCAVGVIGYLYMEGTFSIPGLMLTGKAPNVAIVHTPVLDDRHIRLRKAIGELMLSSQTSIPSLITLAKENPTDASGKEAIEALLGHYKSRRNTAEAGRFLMSLGRPLEASQFFLSEPPSYREAEEAIFAGYQVINQANKRDLLIQDIRLLLGQANNVPLAIERIRLLERDFRGQKHPFGYYLTSVDSRIVDIFNRISFFFVQKLLVFIESEFPQMNLAKRPIVEIQKDKRGRYRVVGKYEGPITLQHDKMDNMRIVFWYAADQWVVVETNLTSERSKWASEARLRIKDIVLNGPDMLTNLENIFKGQFPKAALHEAVAVSAPPLQQRQ